MSKREYRLYAKQARKNHDEVFPKGTTQALIKSSLYQADKDKKRNTAVAAGASAGAICLFGAVMYVLSYGVF